ncbi:MAG: hypothetical protein WD651_10220 [Acidimicrobiia bacterium]
MALLSGRPRLAELLASLSLAADLGTGQALGHGLRTCMLAVALAREMGCGPDEVRSVHQVALLRFFGCTAEAPESARGVGGDDLSSKSLTNNRYQQACLRGSHQVPLSLI